MKTYVGSMAKVYASDSETLECESQSYDAFADSSVVLKKMKKFIKNV